MIYDDAMPGPADVPNRAPPERGSAVLVGALVAVVLPVALSLAFPDRTSVV